MASPSTASRFSSASTLAEPVLQFEGSVLEQQWKRHFLDLLSISGPAPVSERYFYAWCRFDRPKWTDLFFSEDGWDSSRFEDVLDEFQEMALGSRSGSWRNFEFVLAERVRDYLRTELAESERLYRIEFSAVLTAYLDQGGNCIGKKEENVLLEHINSCLDRDGPRLFENSASLASAPPGTAYFFALVYQSAGWYGHAQYLIEIAMALQASDGGIESTRYLHLKEVLALLQMQQGNFDDAEILLKSNMQIRARKVGFQHPDTLQSIENLANCFRNQGQFLRAEHHFLQVLSKTKKPWPTLRNNFAILLSELGRCEEAQDMFEELVKERTRQLGSRHVDTLSTSHNLAALLCDQAKYDQAEPIAAKTLQRKIEVLGSDHPDVFCTTKVLANIYVSRNELDKAENLLLKALGDSRSVLGPSHPDTVSLMDGLAVVQTKMNDLERAKITAHKALHLSTMRYGCSHPYTLEIVQNLAFVYQAEQNVDRAESLYLEILNNESRPTDVQKQCAIESLTRLYDRQGRGDEAKRLKARFESH